MKYIKVWTDFVEDMSELSYAERGRLFTAMLEYGRDGQTDAIAGNERYTWCTAKKMLDAQRESNDQRCAINKRIATNRYQSLPNGTKRNETCHKQEQEQEQEQEHINKRRRFVPPTLTEVQEFCSANGLVNVDPQSFIDFYASKDWMVGKNKMRDWKAAARGWNRRSIERAQPSTRRRSNFAERQVKDEDFADLFLPL